MDNTLAINNAASQYDRLLKALAEDYVRVDERSFEELLAFAVKLGELINFYNLKDQVEGDWAPFFITDQAMILASIAGTDLWQMEAQFLETEHGVKQNYAKKFEHFTALFRLVISPARKINLWLRGLTLILHREDDSRIAGEIREAISDSLRNQLRTLRSYDHGAGLKNALERAIGLNYDDFLPIWNIEKVSPDGCIYVGRTIAQKIDHALPYLQAIFYSFFYEIDRLQKTVSLHHQDLFEHDHHKPYLALYFTFVKLFARARENINRYTGRFTAFYYDKILRTTLKPYIADSLFLSFELEEDENLTESFIPKGTLFSAGQDENGQDILYASDSGILVNSSKIKKIYTIHRKTGPLYEESEPVPPLAPEKCEDIPENTTSHLNSGIAMRNNLDLETEDASIAAFPPFGAGREMESDFYVNSPACFGFAFSSKLLFLKGGNRTIKFKFYYSKRYKNRLDSYLDALHCRTGIPKDELFKKILERSFKIFLSTESGWFQVEQYGVALPKDGKENLGGSDPNRFEIKVTLSPAMPAIRNFNPEEDEAGAEDSGSPEADAYTANPDARRPTVKFYLNTDWVEFRKTAGGESEGLVSDESIRVTPLSILYDWDLVELAINIQVTGLGGNALTLRNNQGELDPENPFNPFGAPPAVGSYLLIGNTEIFEKRLSTLAMNLVWFNLPQNQDGFSGYYQKYKIGLDDKEGIDPAVDNTVFKGDFSVVTPKIWPLALKSPKKGWLFRTYKTIETTNKSRVICQTDAEPKSHGKLCEAARFEFVTPLLKEALSEAYPSDETYIKLELSAPPYAFGDDIYALNVIKAVVENFPDNLNPVCPDPENPKPFVCPPNPPYLPTVQSLTIDYSAEDTYYASDNSLEGQGIRFFRLYPYEGIESVGSSSANDGEGAYLLPHFDDQGNLLLGFSGLTSRETLTLLFKFTENGDQNSSVAPPAIHWSYLSENRWNPLETEQVLSDTTNGFHTSGILKLNIPGVSNENTILSSNFRWLRASVPAESEGFPNIVDIWPQAVTATWHDKDNTGSHLKQPLPAFTIQTAVDDLPGIENILQPIESFNGRPAETHEKMYVRIGERLRHKNRAILAWDYERLVLEGFPEIYKVKCLTTRNPSAGDMPGNVLIVVVPGPDSIDAEDPIEPRAGNRLLTAIKTYLEELISPFIKIHVVNPVYRTIKVETVVQFKNGTDTGHGIQTLNDSLVRYLSPWFYNAERESLAGNYVTESAVSEFIQTRPYVYYMQSLSLVYQESPQEWVFLTSARNHKITSAPVLPYHARRIEPAIG